MDNALPVSSMRAMICPSRKAPSMQKMAPPALHKVIFWNFFADVKMTPGFNTALNHSLLSLSFLSFVVSSCKVRPVASMKPHRSSKGAITVQTSALLTWILRMVLIMALAFTGALSNSSSHRSRNEPDVTCLCLTGTSSRRQTQRTVGTLLRAVLMLSAVQHSRAKCAISLILQGLPSQNLNACYNFDDLLGRWVSTNIGCRLHPIEWAGNGSRIGWQAACNRIYGK